MNHHLLPPPPLPSSAPLLPHLFPPPPHHHHHSLLLRQLPQPNNNKSFTIFSRLPVFKLPSFPGGKSYRACDLSLLLVECESSHFGLLLQLLPLLLLGHLDYSLDWKRHILPSGSTHLTSPSYIPYCSQLVLWSALQRILALICRDPLKGEQNRYVGFIILVAVVVVRTGVYEVEAVARQPHIPFIYLGCPPTEAHYSLVYFFLLLLECLIFYAQSTASALDVQQQPIPVPESEPTLIY